MNYISSIFHYIFAPIPGTHFTYYNALAILASILIVGGIFFSNYYNKRKKNDIAFKISFRSLSKYMITFGLIFVILMLVRYERIPYFSMRLWLYVTFALFLYFAYRFIQIYRLEYPKQKEFKTVHSKKMEQQKNEKVYLPNKKKR